MINQYELWHLGLSFVLGFMFSWYINNNWNKEKNVKK